MNRLFNFQKIILKKVEISLCFLLTIYNKCYIL
nr:MAG TPA: hypothetical protein [Caudoviricetes sp.]